MNHPAGAPPRWAEWLLERVLVGADRQTVVGDLHEEYCDAALPHVGPVRADLSYLGQVLSLIPRAVFGQGLMRKVLLAASTFTFGSCCWLAVMEWVLRHSGYLLRSRERSPCELSAAGSEHSE